VPCALVPCVLASSRHAVGFVHCGVSIVALSSRAPSPLAETPRVPPHEQATEEAGGGRGGSHPDCTHSEDNTAQEGECRLA